MSEPKVIFVPLSKYAVAPKRHSDGAAGYDMYSITPGCVQPHSTMTLPMGFALKIPPGLFGYVCGRSGFALRNSINVEGSYVTSESEVKINLSNHSTEAFVFDRGVRIAQIFFAKMEETPTFEMKPARSN